MATPDGSSVRGSRVVTWPLGERSTITLRQFPDHDELVTLHVEFEEGTKVAGYPPIDIEAWATEVVGEIRLYEACRHGAAAFIEQLRRDGIVGDLDDEESRLQDMTRVLLEHAPGQVAGKAFTWARKRRRRQRISDDFLREVAAYRDDHTAAETAVKYGVNVRTVFRWDKRAQGLTEE